MKTLRHIFGTGIVIAAILMTGSKSFGQTDLNFTAITPTVESAMQMTWTSVSNEVYQIQYADTLYDTNTGLVTWNTLYDNYPSQGTNTFWPVSYTHLRAHETGRN